MTEQKQERQLKQLIASILQEQGACRLCILFGSLAAGTGHWESDLNIAVDMGKPLTPDGKITLMGELAEKIGHPIGLIDLQTVGQPLLGKIVQYEKKICGSNADYARLISRHLFDQADFMPYRNRILAERRLAWIGR
jgi:predicted nucleotidyltransferase